MECLLFQKCDEWDKDKVEDFCKDTMGIEAKVEDDGCYLVARVSDSFKEPIVGEHRLIRVSPTVSFIVREDPELDQFLEEWCPEDPEESRTRPGTPTPPPKLTCIIPPDEFKETPEDFKRLKIEDFDTHTQSVLAE